MPTVLDKQGAQLLAVAVLVVSRTWIPDRIASLNGTNTSELVSHVLSYAISFVHDYICTNSDRQCLDFKGTTVKYVLEQDKAAFVRLIGVSVLQSAASSFVAPSLRYLLSFSEHQQDLKHIKHKFSKQALLLNPERRNRKF